MYVSEMRINHCMFNDFTLFICFTWLPWLHVAVNNLNKAASSITYHQTFQQTSVIICKNQKMVLLI